MLTRGITIVVLALAWSSAVDVAAAQHERPYEFDDTHVAISIERFMGIDYIDPEGPGGGDATARVLLNASDTYPTTSARFGLDVFIERLSIGVAGGVTSEDVAILAPRIGYMFGLTPNLGFWLRGGAFYAATPEPSFFGITAEALFNWFPYSYLAFHIGPTLDLGFADDERYADYLQIGILETGMTAWF